MLARWTGGGRMTKAEGELDKAKSKLAHMREKWEETTESLMGSAEISAAAFGLGYVNGRYGGLELFGVPLELLLGAGLTLVAQTKIAGKSSGHMANLGNGALAVYFGTLGTGLGRQSRSQAAVPAVTPPAA